MDWHRLAQVPKPTLTTNESAYLRLRAEGLIGCLLESFEEAQAYEFPGEGPQIAIQLLVRALEVLRKDLQENSDEATFVIYLEYLEFLGGLLRYFDNGETEQTPRGLALLLEDFVQHLKPGAKLVLWPRTDYNYAIAKLRDQIGGLLKNIFIPEAEALAEEISQREILLVSFPRIDRENILQHVTLGHELGHVIAEEFLASYEQSEEGKAETTRLVAEARKLGEGEGDGEDDEFENKTKLVDLVLTLRKRALEELVSDAVGIYVFGPSAAFALHDLLMPHGWDELPVQDEYYPPSRKRLRLCCSLLEEEGHLECLTKLKGGERGSYFASASDRVAELQGLAAVTTDLDLIAAYEEWKLAYDSVDKTLQVALKFTKDRVTNISYSSTVAQAELPELVERIAADLPPNEYGLAETLRVADKRSAILAAWIWRIHCKLEDGTACSAKDIAKVQKLTIRAIEYIFLQKEYAQFSPAASSGSS